MHTHQGYGCTLLRTPLGDNSGKEEFYRRSPIAGRKTLTVLE